MEMQDVTVGVVSYYRPERIERCLKSIEENANEFQKIVVADNGEIGEEKEQIYYDYSQKLNLEILDLELDCGVAVSRNKIVENLQTEYLLLIDDDMTVPSNVDVLYRILNNKQSLGGVAGGVYEYGEIRIGAGDLFFENYMGQTYLVKNIKEEKRDTVQTAVGEKSIYLYDFVQTCSLIRKECLKDASWDENYKIEREHRDFFLEHKINTRWKFALCDEVLFGHYPGGSSKYMNERKSKDKISDSESYFQDKWRIDKAIELKRHYETSSGLLDCFKKELRTKLPTPIVYYYRVMVSKLGK